MITFIVPGPPVPWARARRAGNRYFVDAKTAAHKQKIAHAARKAGVKCVHQPNAVEVVIIFFLPRPKKSGPFPTRRPDGDNYLKLVMDALNGIAWLDDAMVISATVHKRYADEDDPMSTHIEINVLDA